MPANTPRNVNDKSKDENDGYESDDEEEALWNHLGPDADQRSVYVEGEKGLIRVSVEQEVSVKCDDYVTYIEKQGGLDMLSFKQRALADTKTWKARVIGIRAKGHNVIIQTHLFYTVREAKEALRSKDLSYRKIRAGVTSKALFLCTSDIHYMVPAMIIDKMVIYGETFAEGKPDHVHWYYLTDIEI